MISSATSFVTGSSLLVALFIFIAATLHVPEYVTERGVMTTTSVKQPQDHKTKQMTNAQRTEALNTPVTFTFDGDEFTVTPSDATSLEFLEALEDEQIIAALRHLLGREQASKLIKGRKIEDLEGFFEDMGKAVDLGNQ